MTGFGDACSDCGFELPPDIDAFSDGRQPCPLCGSFRRTFSGDASFVAHGSLTAAVAAQVATGSTDLLVLDYDSAVEAAVEPPEVRRATAKETKFGVRFVHPELDGGAWMAVVDGPDGRMLTADLGECPDEALAAVIESIVGYDFGAG